jgi:uncharacterized membrane protein YhiD involved in acid resistance
MRRTRRRRGVVRQFAIVALLVGAAGVLGIVNGARASAQQPDPFAAAARKGEGPPPEEKAEVYEALVRLPVAALLGAALAVRPRRRGTPPRQPAVIQTQIILAIVGSVVMMVVGTNLARAFGVVGAAGLVRYRAKIEDPKDAGVMLSTLAIGLASGVGLYAMATVSAVFILIALWIIESFEPRTLKLFELKVKMGEDTDGRRAEIEGVLRRQHVDFELSTSSDEEVCYDVRVPLDLERDRITNAILTLDPAGHAAVEWNEKKSKNK